MADLVNLDDMRPHTAQEIVCIECVKRWVAVAPGEEPLPQYECPECGGPGLPVGKAIDNMTLRDRLAAAMDEELAKHAPRTTRAIEAMREAMELEADIRRMVAGEQRMICPDCRGNGYWIEQLRVMRQVRQCETCNSQGEIEESKDAKTDED